MTLDELMNKAQEDIDSGQPVLSLERQEKIVSGLSRLLAILMDRRDLEDLEL